MTRISFQYVHQLQEHLAQVRSHLSGEAKDALPSSFIAPATYWTSSEKHAFFRALARYSRLNPDLIAAHIKTKSIVDVCVYIEQLEAASKANPIPWSRTQQDIALQVSDDWIRFEERNAIAFIAAEPFAHDSQRKSVRQMKLNEKRKELSKAGTSNAFDTWEQDIGTQWGREDLLESLDTLKLKILDSILRTGAPVLPPPIADNDLGKTVPDPTNAISSFETLCNGDIDTAPCSSFVHSVSSTADTEQHALNTSVGDNITGSAYPSSQEVVTPRMVLDEMTFNPPAQMAYENLSPADRRRLKRRLYMRRRRAEQSGAEVDYTTARLRPGKRPGGNPARKRVGGKARMYHQEVFPSKQFSEHQIDFATLQQNGLDLFHLSTLSQLLGFYKSGCANKEENTVTSISAGTMRLLRSVAVNFISEVIHRAIVFKNQESQIKGDIKAWGCGQKIEISSGTIHSCLEMMGFYNLNKNGIFEQSRPCQFSTDIDEGENNSSEPMHTSPGILLEYEVPPGCCLPTSLLGLDDASAEEHQDDLLSDTDESYWTVMKEEGELDTQDEKIQGQYETSLWKDVTDSIDTHVHYL